AALILDCADRRGSGIGQADQWGIRVRAVDDKNGAGTCASTRSRITNAGKEGLDFGEQPLRLFDVRNMAAVLEDDQKGAKRFRGGARRRERNGILATGKH